ncbi:MAG: 30S ribosomal protein S4e [Candidatus Aenigmarchaeota archaeon]|nr:30S ribosomal protein S4e [Candidatus Aenigmarchaeota archaeon]
MRLHLKRLLVPRFWKIPKKLRKWAVAPRPGPHPKEMSIPLLVVVRDLLKLAETGKEAKKIIKAGEVLVDGRKRKDHKFPVGFMDVVSIPKIKKHYRVGIDQHGLKLVEIKDDEANKKLCRIEDKTIVKGGKTQLNLHDGRNVLVEEDVYKTGDSILIELPTQKILKHIKLEKDSLAVIIGGQNMGSLVKVKEVIVTRSREPNKVTCVKGKEEITAIKDYVFVVGKDKPLVTVVPG